MRKSSGIRLARNIKAARVAAVLVLATAAVSATVLTASPSYAAGGCVNKSQNGWTIRLCANKDFVAATSDFYVLKKGTTGGGCSVEGNYYLNGDFADYNSWSCSSIGTNQQEIIGTETAIGGATIKTCVDVKEDVVPFRTFFSQCQTFTDV
ncbi:hypothetical protein [Actinoallomurus sp. NPDC050550]|uniref:hypothetical protein n=1 Tax=Actinoallomurus sp. NPDC050550 TaxID=3154937 RepID=UPI00340372CB